LLATRLAILFLFLFLFLIVFLFIFLWISSSQEFSNTFLFLLAFFLKLQLLFFLLNLLWLCYFVPDSLLLFQNLLHILRHYFLIDCSFFLPLIYDVSLSNLFYLLDSITNYLFNYYQLDIIIFTFIVLKLNDISIVLEDYCLEEDYFRFLHFFWYYKSE
jgi:hypothetical protein